MSSHTIFASVLFQLHCEAVKATTLFVTKLLKLVLPRGRLFLMHKEKWIQGYPPFYSQPASKLASYPPCTNI